MEMITRYSNHPKRSFFLFGPRGTGKSTILKQQYPQALLIDLLDSYTQRLYIAKPERLKEIIAAGSDKQIIIDEIQQAPQLLSIVHSIIVSNKNIQFILTGSSARKIKRQDTNLLGGRASYRSMHPFMASELKELFSLKSSLVDGLLPLLYYESDPKDVLQSYISLYLKEEIKQEGLVRNLDDFARFLESISFSHGSLLNVSNVARDCQVKRKTVENYLVILEDLLLAYRINVFRKHAKRDLVSHSKFYFFDTGVYKAIKPTGILENPSQINGSALEGLVGQHLRAWCDYSSQKHELYFWRTSSGAEVDFIVYGETGLWAIEIKHSKDVNNKDVRALKSFCSDYPMAKAAVVYNGSDTIKINNIMCYNAEFFLLNVVPNKHLF